MTENINWGGKLPEESDKRLEERDESTKMTIDFIFLIKLLTKLFLFENYYFLLFFKRI